MTALLANPWVHGGLYGLIIASVAMLGCAYLIWFERKFAGRMQSRLGPTEVGPMGLLQPIADLLKLLQKEDLIPGDADRALFNLAPPLTVLFTLGAFAVIPLSSEILIADLSIGVLFAISISSMLVIPVWMAGWASNNKYALLGGMRAVAQSISYEIPLLLTALVPIILAGSLSIGDIVEAQQGGRWFAFWPPGPGFFAFVLFFLASLAESNRIPFDIPEAESELVAGITTEYSGMKFGLFYLAEYLHTFVSSALAAAMFLGGWDGPGPDGMHWMLAKTFLLLFTIYWARWSFMRYRSDQLLKICWHYAVPASLALVAFAALWVHFGQGAT
jgi:NADH-quinone oxidoreductase subunit H